MQKKITSDQKKYFGRMIDLAKILVYSRSYNIQVEEKLEKFFYLRAKESRCGEDVFNHKKRLTSNFKDLLKLEMFLRTRFLPTQKSVQLSKEDYKKAIKGAKNLIQSISDQLDEAVYW